MVEMGDRVKLTDRAAQTRNRGGCPMRRRTTVDWTKRRGVVWSGGQDTTLVKWDDRRTLDEWPAKALEKV